MLNIYVKIIVNRHVVNDEDVRIFITPTRDDFHDPFLFKGMDIAVERIIKAINKGYSQPELKSYIEKFYCEKVCLHLLNDSLLKLNYYS